MTPDPNPESPLPECRFAAVSRRAFLKRAAMLGAAAWLPAALASCANDAAVFASGATTTTAASPPDGSTTSVATTTAPSTTGTTTTTAPETTTTGPAGSGMPPGAEMLIAFTYAASSSGFGAIRNPYVAVWIEDGSGELVDTVALWFLRSQKGLRWLGDLRRWAMVDGSQATVSTVSSSTRRPGDYSLAWGGVDIDGSPVPAGDYFICIEAAREHGPYSLIRQPFTLAGDGFTIDLPDDGELHDASIELAA